MNLSSPAILKSILEKHNIHPSRRLGQNFLIDKNILNKIVQAADLTKDDTVIEVGPGVGVLTQELAGLAKKVIAIEKDRKMTEILGYVLEGIGNVEIINEDILKWENNQTQLYKVVANLPYYITSPVVRKFLEASWRQPNCMVLMVQKEVADRMVAVSPDMSILAVATQFYGKPKIVAKVSKNSFWPIPKVDSAIIRITRDERYTKDARGKEKVFFRLVKVGFASKRKQLIGNLARGFNISREELEKIFNQLGFNMKVRAQELTISQWISLLQEIGGYIIMKENAGNNF